MASDNGDKKRNQIISLLYIVFICFSVISIKISLLDSNTYVISTLKSLDKEEILRMSMSEKVIEENSDILNDNEKAMIYLKIAERIKVSYEIINEIINYVDNAFEESNSSMLKQFNSKNLITKILASENGVVKLENDLFELEDFIKSQPYKLDSISSFLYSSIPLNKNITTIKGKIQPWKDYLFLKKPTAIAYLQLERIKLLLSKTILLYKEEALEEIGYNSTYSSIINPRQYNLKTYKDDVILKDYQKAVNKEDVVIGEMFKNLLKSLNTDNIYVGIKAIILNQTDLILKDGIEIEIEPKIKTENRKNVLKGYFNKKGIYNIRFIDTSNGQNNVLFESFGSAQSHG